MVRATHEATQDPPLIAAAGSCATETERISPYDEGHSLIVGGSEAPQSSQRYRECLDCVLDKIGMPQWVSVHRDVIGADGTISVGDFTMTWHTFDDLDQTIRYVVYDSAVGGGERSPR
jgi:hypothetical protein